MDNRVSKFVAPACCSHGSGRVPLAVYSWKALLIPLVVLAFVGRPGVAPAGIGTWTSIGPEGGSVQALAIDPMTPTILYAGTAGAGVFKSTDGGNTWSAIHTGLTNTTVLALSIDPVTPTTVYAGTNGGGVFKLQQAP